MDLNDFFARKDREKKKTPKSKSGNLNSKLSSMTVKETLNSDGWTDYQETRPVFRTGVTVSDISEVSNDNFETEHEELEREMAKKELQSAIKKNKKKEAAPKPIVSEPKAWKPQSMRDSKIPEISNQKQFPSLTKDGLPDSARVTTGKIVTNNAWSALAQDEDEEAEVYEPIIPPVDDVDPQNVQTFFEIQIGSNIVGKLVFELFRDVPRTSENFRALCTGERGRGIIIGKKLTYKGSIFHRVIRRFMAQGGDIQYGNGSGGESIYGKNFRDENFKHHHDRRGLLSMANSGPNTNGSQFFITFSPQDHLNGSHVVFGRVIDGFDVLEKMERVLTDEESKPISDHEITIVDCGQIEIKHVNFGWWNKENSVYPFVRDAQKESVTEEIDQRIESMIQEFVEIENIDELDICLRELNSPQSHELFVKSAIYAGLESTSIRTQELIGRMLISMCLEKKSLLPDHLQNGFSFFTEEEINDFKIDCPRADKRFSRLKDSVQKSGLLDVPRVLEHPTEPKQDEIEILNAQEKTDEQEDNEEENFVQFKGKKKKKSKKM